MPITERAAERLIGEFMTTSASETSIYGIEQNKMQEINTSLGINRNVGRSRSSRSTTSNTVGYDTTFIERKAIRSGLTTYFDSDMRLIPIAHRNEVVSLRFGLFGKE